MVNEEQRGQGAHNKGAKEDKVRDAARARSCRTL